MRFVVFLAVLVLHGIFAVLNSTALMRTDDINLGFAQYSGPLGLILLATSAALWVLSFVWLTLSTLRREAGSARLLRDMDSLRQTVDSQEASRFAQLQAGLEARFANLDAQLQKVQQLSSQQPQGVQQPVSLQKSSQEIQLRQELAELSAYLRRKLGE